MAFYFIIISALFVLLFSYLQYKYQYWRLHGVPQLEMNFLFGNLFRLQSFHKSELLHEVYQEFRGKAKLAGTYVFTQPIVVILDLNLAKSILIKDFHIFTDRFERKRGQRDLFKENLFGVYGEKWRPLRSKLTPTFSSAKMKFMFPTLVAVAEQLEHAFTAHLEQTPGGAIEMHDMMARFTTDVIGHCAFGVNCNSLKDPNAEFRRIGRDIFYSHNFSIRLRLLMQTYPIILKLLNVCNLNYSPKKIEDFVMRLVCDTVHLREEQKLQCNDFLNLLIEIKNTKGADCKPAMSIVEMAAQVFIFFAAGFETSSSNMSFGLYELAKNPRVQEKLRTEIVSVLSKYNGQLSYEAMMEMTYLNQVITETLRKYPALSALTRVSVADYKIPDTKITLEKGSRIYIPVKEIHYDSDIYDNPTEFRPERFSQEEMQTRHPQAFLGFGDGPRNCIGLRFGRMQVRVGLITLLKSFRFNLLENPPAELEISKSSMVLVPHGGVWLKAEKL